MTRGDAARRTGCWTARRPAPWCGLVWVLFWALQTLACSSQRPPHAGTLPAGTPPRLLVMALDAVPYDVVAKLSAEGVFAGFHAPVPMISTFPSATSLAMSGILEPFGLDRSTGYEARFFDRARNRIRGGGLLSYNRLRFPWREAWDWKTGTAHKLASGMAPVRASAGEMDDALAAFLASDQPIFLAYNDATDLAGHLKSPSALDAILRRLAGRLNAMHQEHPNRPFYTVLFSDHGQAGGAPLLNVRRGVHRALHKADFRRTGHLHSARDIVLVPFGLLSSLIAYTAPDSAWAAAAAIATVDGVDLCVAAHGDDAWQVLGHNGEAVVERQRLPHGRTLWRYRHQDGDPLALGALLDDRDDDGWHEDAWWYARTLEHIYPDALYRIARGFELVENPASVICSLETRAMYGAKLTSMASRMSVGHLKWTHGALHRTPTLGFVMSDLPGWQPQGAVRFDQALVPFANYARERYAITRIIEGERPIPALAPGSSWGNR